MGAGKQTILTLVATGVAILSSLFAKGQEDPPIPINVYVSTAQGLNFGAFYPGSAGGNVIVYPTGLRSVTGDVVEVSAGYSYTPAMYEIEANPGTLITILGSVTTLTGSNGGSMTLTTGDADPALPLITTAIPPARTLLNLGGTLSVNNMLANPPGFYSGIFQVTFIQE
jgi:hypothetical protein